MKVIYNGAYGPVVTMGGIAYTAGVPIDIDASLAAVLIAKGNFSEIKPAKRAAKPEED